MMSAARTAFYAFIGRIHALMGRSPEESTKEAKRVALEGRTFGEPEVAITEAAAEIRVYDYIDNQMMCEWFGVGVSDVGFLKALDKARAAGKPIVVRLNSGGGDVFAGLAIASAVAEHKLDVVVDGIAASIASVIMARAKHATMKLGATVMLHNPWSGVMGNAQAMRAEAAVLDQIREGMIDVYAARTGAKHTREQWAATLDGVDGADGTWWTGDQAVAAGFADAYEHADPRAAILPAAALLETRKNVAAVMGVRLPKILETEVDPGPPLSEEPAPSGNTKPAALGGQGQKEFQPGVRVSHRPGAFYIGK